VRATAGVESIGGYPDVINDQQPMGGRRA